jgi:tetratricopeptide (TPR) repeat protein
MAAVSLLSIWFLAAQLSGDPARVVADLQASIRAEPTKESNYTDLGNVLLGTQNFTEAIVVLEHARQRFPQSPQAALSLGVAYYGSRRFSDAVDAFIATSKLAPDIEQPVMFLWRVWEHVGPRETEAIECFRAFVKVKPQSPLGHFVLGAALGDEAELRRSLALGPHPETHIELATLLEKQAKLPAAAAELEKAARMAPKNPIPHYKLFRLYSRLGQPQRAAQEKALHEKLTAAEKAEADRRQAATKHLNLKVQKP